MSQFCSNDYDFGPVSQCRTFDFTLAFEQIILFILPAAIVLTLCGPIFFSLRHRRRCVRWRSALFTSKLILNFAFLLVATIFAALLSSIDQYDAGLWRASAAMAVLEAGALFVISVTQHLYSIRPSTFLAMYLSSTVLFGIVILRSFFLVHLPQSTAVLFGVQLSLRVLLNFSENWSKATILTEEAFERSTRETLAGFWSTSSQLWMLPLFNAGYSRKLGTDDLTEFYDNGVCKDDSVRLETSFASNRSVVRATVSAFRWQIIGSIIPGFVQIAATLAQPELINRFISFTNSYSGAGPEQPPYYGWSLAFCFFLVYSILACAKSAYTMLNIHLMTRFQGAMISLLYTKSMTISSSETGACMGSASTYMSVDTQKICEMMQKLHDPWQNFLTVGFALWLLYRQLQYAMFAVFAVVLFVLLTPFALTPKTVAFSAAWGGETEKRVQQMTSFLQHMKAIKLSAFERSVVEPVMEVARDDELRALGKWYKILIASIFGGDSLQMSATVIGFMAYALIHVRNGDSFSTETTFTALSLIVILVQPIDAIIQTLPNVFAAYGGAMRLQEFLVKSDFCNDTTENLEIRSEAFAKSKSGPEANVIELPALASNGKLNKSVNGTQHFELHKAAFKWTPASTSNCLEELCTRFPEGLTMIIGEVGSGKTCLLHSLLGETIITSGVIHRPNVPVALCTQDPWIRNASLRENIISPHPFEAKWYNEVLDACNLLQDMALLRSGDQTIIGSKGQNLSGGQKQRVALARAVYSSSFGVHTFFFDDIFSAVDKGTEALIFSALFGPRGLLKSMTVLLVSHGISRLSAADNIILLSAGKIVQQGTWQEVLHVGKLAALLHEAKTVQDTNHQADETSKSKEALEDFETVERSQTIHYDRGWAPYLWYFSTLGAFKIILGFGSIVVYVAMYTGEQLLLKRWSEQEDPRKNLSTYIGIMWILLVLYSAAWCINLYTVCYLWSIKAGRIIHKRLLSGLLSTKFSFFNNNSVGFILNRFSQDVFELDFEIPTCMDMLFFPLFSSVAQIGIVCAAVPYVAITIPFLLYGLYNLQRYYLRTSRQVKTITLESKTPLFTSFLETLEGVITIRAGRQQTACIQANNFHLDQAQPAFFLSFGVMRGVTMVLDITAAFLVTCLVLLAVALRHSTSGGLIGLALIQIIQLQYSFNQIVMCFTNLETGMVAVERIKEFSSLPPEDPKPDADNGEWLTKGKVEYRDVTAKYHDDEDSPIALSNITFEIPAGHKIGVCGRTGSGKSSLLLTLFRAMDNQSGQILIDGLDTNCLSLHDLRSHITIVPQDPALWSGTLRANLDPLHACTDLEIWNAIARVNLTELVTNLPGSLDHKLDASASFSSGQRQLICLARACLRRSKIVVLDEATSSMDVLTDQVVQQVVREVFKDATVITIAHRLQTILDYDKILILDRGTIAEYDSPKTLLSDPESMLSSMVRGERQGERQGKEEDIVAVVIETNDEDEIQVVEAR